METKNSKQIQDDLDRRKNLQIASAKRNAHDAFEQSRQAIFIMPGRGDKYEYAKDNLRETYEAFIDAIDEIKNLYGAEK